jgi:hypothetical protein
MALNPMDHRGVVPHYTDPIRIVPLHLPASVTEHLVDPAADAAAVAAVGPQLTYRNGPLMSNVKVFTIFWGSAWQTGQLKTLAGNINNFFKFIVTSPLIDQLAEYNAGGYTIGHGQLAGTATVTDIALRRSTSDTAIRLMLQREISTNMHVPMPDANTLYFVYLPPGIPVTQGGARSCQAFCGYHDNISGQLFYAVMPYPGCQGCTGGLSVMDSLTSTSSHELCEAITDPIPGQGWYDDQNGEIGDICAWTTKKVGAYTVQKEWSNKANACV